MPQKKKKKNSYFTKDHENAIIAYASTDDYDTRNNLYVKMIGPVFDEMVDKIVYTYKFNNLPNIDVLKEDCKIWLTTILNKYDPNKGSKAFSYFSVVTKNWFIHKIKTTSKKNRIESSYEEMIENGNPNLRNVTVSGEEYYETRSEYEFWNMLRGQIDAWDTPKLKENEKKVLEATKILIDNIDNLEIFNKKAVYLYLREITGLNTKQVVTNLKKIREKYKLFKIKYERGEI
tara:strand:- start:27920 stop:28615 length:696 start_codon:yes stop_codon:yes gene_type:complete